MFTTELTGRGWFFMDARTVFTLLEFFRYSVSFTEFSWIPERRDRIPKKQVILGIREFWLRENCVCVFTCPGFFPMFTSGPINIRFCMWSSFWPQIVTDYELPIYLCGAKGSWWDRKLRKRVLTIEKTEHSVFWPLNLTLGGYKWLKLCMLTWVQTGYLCWWEEIVKKWE